VATSSRWKPRTCSSATSASSSAKPADRDPGLGLALPGASAGAVPRVRATAGRVRGPVRWLDQRGNDSRGTMILAGQTRREAVEFPTAWLKRRSND
jgi:hypothetical protein